MKTPFAIAAVRDPHDLAGIRQLFQAYAESLPVDLAYQGFADELAGLPGKYAPPQGELLLARNPGGMALGCVALRSLAAPHTCEMKRLFVAPAGRGLGCGQALAEAAIRTGRQLGYRSMCLDTLPTMADAQRLYARLGFQPIAPYYNTPVAGTVFLSRTL